MSSAAPRTGPGKRTEPTARTVTAQVRRTDSQFVRATDFTGPQAAVHKTLSQLAGKGELIRIRRGLYWRGTRTPLGMAPPTPAQTVRTLSGNTAYGPAGLTAANLFGLTTQIPRHPTYAVTRNLPGIKQVRLIRRGGQRGAGRTAAQLTGTEVAILETLDAWERVVELPDREATMKLADPIRETPGSIERLTQAGQSEPVKVQKRLQHLLGAAGTSTTHQPRCPAPETSGTVTERDLLRYVEFLGA